MAYSPDHKPEVSSFSDSGPTSSGHVDNETNLQSLVNNSGSPRPVVSSEARLYDQSASGTILSQGQEATYKVATNISNRPNGNVGYLANRRSAPSLRQTQSFDGRHRLSDVTQLASSAPRLKKASSFVRISTTGEGSAEVVTKDGTSPSPPRPSQTLQPSITKDSSEAGSAGGPNLRLDLSAGRRVHRSSSGRSRDSRAWEFWCDKDTRSELEEKAEKSASGSAADAIGLLRSASGRSILGAIPSKRINALSRQSTSSKRSKLDLTKSTLQRSTTSFGRLQSTHVGDNSVAKSSHKFKHSESMVSVTIPGNDSDKENWSPDVDAASDRDSGDFTSSGLRSSGVGKPLDRANQNMAMVNKRPRASFSTARSNNPETDPELVAFMGGARKSSSISAEEDLDCIQGLLSLSQGNWK